MNTIGKEIVRQFRAADALVRYVESLRVHTGRPFDTAKAPHFATVAGPSATFAFVSRGRRPVVRVEVTVEYDADRDACNVGVVTSEDGRPKYTRVIEGVILGSVLEDPDLILGFVKAEIPAPAAPAKRGRGRPRLLENRTRWTVYLPGDLAAFGDKLAAATDDGRSGLIRQLLADARNRGLQSL